MTNNIIVMNNDNISTDTSCKIQSSVRKYTSGKRFTDVDTIWLKDPRSFLNGDYDMWASMDGPVHYCTGFMALKPSLLSVDLLENWKGSLVTPDINQIKFNSLVKKSEIKHKPLPLISQRESYPVDCTLGFLHTKILKLFGFPIF
jgi:hypothetical protein